MAKIEAVRCDNKGCTHISEPAEGAELPHGWLAVDIYQEGEGNLELKVYCSYSCLNAWTQSRVVSAPKRRRRTRAEIEADEAAARQPSLA